VLKVNSASHCDMKKFCFAIVMVITFYTVNAQNLSGVVNNNEMVPVEGATVSLLNTNYASKSNSDGLFILRNIPSGNYQLQVSCIGYATFYETITIGKNSNFIKIQLPPYNNYLSAVIVNAQKTQELLQAVPLSVTSLSAQQVQDYRLWDLKTLTGIVPNLYSANPGDNRNVSAIRGVATTSYDPAVATYIDGVNQFNLDTYIPQLFDIEQIEVSRGPQGTLYGRNTMGGVINITMRQPSNKTDGFIETNAGNYGLQRYSLALRTPLVKNKLFLGVAGIYNGFNGFYVNQFNNTRLDKQHAFTGNYYLKYLASNKLVITLNAKNYANRSYGPFALSGSPAEAIDNPFKINQNATTKMIDNIFNSSLAINYYGTKFNIASVSTYQKNYRYYTVPIDGDFAPLDAISIVNNYGNKFNKVQVATQEFRLSSPASLSKLKWVTGIYGFYRYSPTKVGTHFGADAAAVGSDQTNFTSINTNIERAYGVAAFGQLSYSISSKWQITAGLRYDYEHKKNLIHGDFQPDGQDAFTTQADTASKASFNALSPKVSLLYQLDKNSNLYATYSRGFRAGGISQLTTDPAQPPLFAYQPEYSNNFEIGSKNTLLNNRLRINLAAFYIKVNNAQVPTLILPEAITITKNAGKLNSYGAEAEIEGRVLKGLDLTYNFGYTNARYQDLVVSSNNQMLNLKDNKQIYTPSITSTLAVQYTCGLKGTRPPQVVFRGEWHTIGDQYFVLANNIQQKAYNIFNVRAGVITKAIKVFIWCSNLLNKHYIDYAYDFGASHLGNPRTYGLTLRKDF
jgi:iron complex outermembrane receptor protein